MSKDKLRFILGICIGFNLGSKEKRNDIYAKYPANEAIVSESDRKRQVLLGKAFSTMNRMLDAGVRTADDEMLRMAEFCMVGLDAKKCHIDYRKAFEELNIREIFKKFEEKKKEETEEI